MAIQFNPNALSRFSNVDFGDDNAIANLGKGDGLVQKDKLGTFLLKPFRAPSTRDRNNAVRTELLKALGQAFDIRGVSEGDGGKTTFSAEFMDRLEELLGPDAFRRGDFGIKNGEVKSGKPLTQRRITAIVDAARAKGKAAAEGPKREEPIYIALDHSKEDKQKFMSFYNAKLDGFEKNGGPSKEEFDNVLSTLFNKVKGTSRTALVELLANGKIAIIRTGIKYASFNGIVSGLRENYDDMVKDRDTRELLDLIVPSIEMASNETIVKSRHDW